MRHAATRKLAEATAADRAAEDQHTLGAIEAAETLARARGVPAEEERERLALFSIEWQCLLLEVHSSERRGQMLAEGAARDELVVEEAFRFDLILDVWRRQDAVLARREQQSADAASSRAALSVSEVRFAHNVKRRLDATLSGGEDEAAIFVVSRKELKAAAAAELLLVEDAECLARHELWTEALDDHSAIVLGLTSSFEGA